MSATRPLLPELPVSNRWRRARSILRPVTLFLVYTAITLRMTEPAYHSFDRGIIGCCDTSLHAWAYWWTRHALLDLGQSPWSTNYMFHPNELGPTALAAMVTYNAILSIPLQLLFGVNVAVNLIALASLVLSAIGAFELIHREAGRADAAFVGSLVYAFAPPLFARLSMGHYHTVAIWPTPLIVLTWLAALRRDSSRAAVASGALLGFQWSVNPYQGSYVVILMVVLGLVTLWTRWSSSSARASLVRSVARAITLVTVTSGIVLLPHLFGIIGDLHAGRSARVPLSAADSFAPDLLAYVVPSPFHSDLKWSFESINRRIGSLDPVRVVFPGYLALSLGLLAVLHAFASCRERRSAAPWVIGFGTMFLLSLGPLLHVNGQTQFKVSDVSFVVPLPFILLWQIPILGEGRTTANMCFTISLCLAVLSGLALAALFRRFPFRPFTVTISLALAAGVLYEGQATPLSVPTIPVSPFYEKVATEPGEFALLEVPLGWRDGRIGYGQLHAEHLYYATVHHKPLVNGYASRVPDEYFQWFASKKALSYLVNPNQPPTPEANDRDLVLRTLRDLDVRYVIVHRGGKQQEVAKYLEGVVGLPQIHQDDQLQAFRVD